MTKLTERQVKILKAIIEEYIETATPVGSEALEKKYELRVSPATVRNEMVRLTQAGYLKQPHASAGRTPTKQSFRLYAQELMQEKQISVAEEVASKEKVWDARFDFDKLMHEAVKALAQRTQDLALAVVDDGTVYHAGYANILAIPEFYDIDLTRGVLSFIDEINEVNKLFARAFGEEEIHLLLGDEMGHEYLEPCGMVFCNFNTGSKKGSVGVIGPNRLNYPTVIPTVRYFKGLIEELAKNL
jgi:heat-inducible transcriptional repressor